MNYQDYVKSEMLVLIPVLYLIGMGLKKSRLNDRWIPLTLGIIGVVLSSLWVVASSQVESLRQLLEAIFISITQGILVAGASVYANQLYRQASKEKDG